MTCKAFIYAFLQKKAVLSQTAFLVFLLFSNTTLVGLLMLRGCNFTGSDLVVLSFDFLFVGIV